MEPDLRHGGSGEGGGGLAAGGWRRFKCRLLRPSLMTAVGSSYVIAAARASDFLFQSRLSAYLNYQCFRVRLQQGGGWKLFLKMRKWRGEGVTRGSRAAPSRDDRERSSLCKASVTIGEQSQGNVNLKEQ